PPPRLRRRGAAPIRVRAVRPRGGGTDPSREISALAPRGPDVAWPLLIRRPARHRRHLSNWSSSMRTPFAGLLLLFGLAAACGGGTVSGGVPPALDGGTDG